MTELRTRPYEAGDAAAVAAMMNLVEVDAGAYPIFTEADIVTVVDARVRDLTRDTRLNFAPDGTLVAAGMVAPPPEGGFRAETFGGVHPRWQGRGIGHALLDWQIRRLDELHDEIAPDAAWEVEAGTSAEHEGAVHLFESFGMKRVRFFLDMHADLGAIPALEMPAGMRVVGYTPDLAERLYQAHVEAFSDHWSFQRRERDDWTRATLASPSFRPDLSRIAFDGDEIAGYVLCYDGADNLHHIGQVGTRRPWRRRGLASALVADTMAAAAAAGKATATLGVDADNPTGAVRIYEHLGFTVKSRFVAYRRPLRPETTGG